LPVGEIYSDVQNVAFGANFDIQPGVGVEVLIYRLSAELMPGAAPNMYFRMRAYLYDGTDLIALYYDNNNPRFIERRKICIDNNRYLRLQHTAGGGQDMGYWGIILKE
jgi:hypothetical protein